MEMDYLMRSMEDDVLVCRDPRAYELAVDGAIIIAGPTGRVAQLDARGELLWRLLDGEASLGELTDELCEGFEVPREEVSSHLGSFVAELLAMNLLVDLAFDDPMPPPGDDEDDDDDLADGGRRLSSIAIPEPCCGSELLDREWLPTAAVRIGDRVLGIRTDELALDEGVRELMHHYLIDEPAAEGNVSILHRPPEADDLTPTLSLHVQSELIARSPSAAKIRELLTLHLTGLSSRSRPGRLWVQALPIGGPNGVIVLGTTFTSALGMVRSVLVRHGWRLAGNLISIDVDRLEVVVDRSAVQLAAEDSRAFDQLSDWTDDGPGLLADGRYPLRAFAIVPPIPPEVADPPDGQPRWGLLDETRLLMATLPLVGGLAEYGLARAVPDVIRIGRHVPVEEPPGAGFVEWLEGMLA